MTNAELALLGLLGEQPRYGYEIEQTIEERGMRDWTEIGFSSIYYLLKKLERKALIESTLEQSDQGAARKVYRLTPAGRAALSSGVIKSLSAPQRTSSPLLLGLANLPGVVPAEALAALRQYRQSLAERREQLRSRWEDQRPLPYFVEALFDYSMTIAQAEWEWLGRFIDNMEKQADPSGGPAGDRQPRGGEQGKQSSERQNNGQIE